MAEEKIHDWTKSKLNKHIQSVILATPAMLPPSLDAEDVSSTGKLHVQGELELSPQAVAQLKTYLGLP